MAGLDAAEPLLLCCHDSVQNDTGDSQINLVNNAKFGIVCADSGDCQIDLEIKTERPVLDSSDSILLCCHDGIHTVSGDSQIDLAIKTKLRPARGASQLQTLHDCHNGLELGCKAASSATVKQVLSR